jgi:glycosyltransferase involved in cell wall biosynthesis
MHPPPSSHMIDQVSEATRDIRLSVIVPVYNGSMCLPRCLEALGRSEYSNFEVIVIDDCSTDDTPQIAERHRARYFRTVRRMGPAGARNYAVQQAGGEIVIFVDADVVVPPNALRLIAENFSQDPQLAAVFGSYDDSPAWKTFLSQYKNLMHHYVHQNSSESAVTFWAGCGAIRKAIFQEFGGFDALKYSEPSIEDIALGHKLACAGRKIKLDKRIEVKHLKRWTFRGLLRADILYRAVPWSKLILESRQVPRDLNLTYGARASALFVLGLTGGCLLIGLTLSGLLRIPMFVVVIPMALLALSLLALNWNVYQFFFAKRGWWFAARAVPAHWFYYLYSSVTFILFAVIHYVMLPFSSARNVRA